MVMEAAAGITYFVVCWKFFLDASIVAVTAAAQEKGRKVQLTQIEVL